MQHRSTQQSQSRGRHLFHTGRSSLSCHLLGWLLSLPLLLLSPQLGWSQSSVDSPAEAETVYGNSVISGWHCDALSSGGVEVQVDDGSRVATFPANRGDIVPPGGPCADPNNGFVLQTLWSLQTEGVHDLTFYLANSDTAFATRQVTVVHLVPEEVFIPSATGQCLGTVEGTTLDGSPFATHVRALWSQGLQNVSIVETGAKALRSSIPAHGADPGPQAHTTYVGVLEDTSTSIAIVTNLEEAVAYICDGAGLSEWFLGTREGDNLLLDGDKDGSIVATLTDTTITGTATSGDSSYAFIATPAVERDSGIYRLVEDEDGERFVTGWIYVNGTLRGSTEDSGKSVIGAVALDGLDTSTGSGTGLNPPDEDDPIPFESCGATFCAVEQITCSIVGLSQEINDIRLRFRLKAQLEQARQAAQDLRDVFLDIAADNGCFNQPVSGCPGTGFVPGPSGAPNSVPTCS